MEKQINWANDYEINESLKEIGTSVIATAIRIMSKLDASKDKALYEKLDKESNDIQDFLNSEKYYATEEEANKAVDSLVAKFKEFDAIEDKILKERGA
ncbi:MAG: hypothetical protein ACK4K9_10200 [Bacteroidia bacterium]